jgi:hypothetical protein
MLYEDEGGATKIIMAVSWVAELGQSLVTFILSAKRIHDPHE